MRIIRFYVEFVPVVSNMGNVPEFFSSQVSQAKRFYLDTYSWARQPLTVVCGD